MAGTEQPISELLQDWITHVTNDVDVDAILEKSLFGDEDFEIDEMPDLALKAVFQTLALDALFLAVTRFGQAGIHFWSPTFPLLYTTLFQVMLRGYVLAHSSVDTVNGERGRIEQILAEIGETLDEQGIIFVAHEPEFEDIDNPFTDGKAEDNGDN